MNRLLGWPSKASILRLFAGVAALLLLLATLGAPPAAAQEGEESAPEVVIFVLDLSGSMNEPFTNDQTKLEAAKVAFSEAFANVSPDALVGLRTYGDQIAPNSPDDRQTSCTTDTRLVTPVGPLQREALIDEVRGFSALGDTPMGLALQAASTDIPAGASGTIVLFSDGRDECFDADLDGDPTSGPSYGEEPCAIARELLNGSTGVERVVTVGFATDAAAESELRCIADVTEGAYTSIETADDARDVLPELLVELSAPREAERLLGRTIVGSEEIETAPDLLDLGLIGASQILYTDTIEMNSERVYRVPNYQPGGGTLTATVFGLPPEPGLTFDLRVYSPRLDREFFEGDHGDFNAGLPERSSASIRCTGCAVGDREGEVFWIISLSSDERGVDGTYEIELLTEGPGFGGPETSCRPPQACYYGAETAAINAEIEALQTEISAAGDELASESLLGERDSARAEADAAQEIVDNTNLRSEELEARIAAAPQQSTSWRLPILMIALGALLAFAPLHKLRRSKQEQADEDRNDEHDGLSGTDATGAQASGTEASIDGGSAASLAAIAVETAPAVTASRAGGHDWDAELEAAKAALAQQRPVHPREEKPAAAAPQQPTSAAQQAVEIQPAVATATPAQPAIATATPAQQAVETQPATPAQQAVETQPAVATATPAAATPAQQAEETQPAVATATPAAATPAQPAVAPALALPAASAATEEPAAVAQQQPAAEPAKATELAAGWYPDPAGQAAYRWWDGSGWTEHTNTGEQGGAS